MTERSRGCLIGLAVGDAFGAPVEFLSRDAIMRKDPPDGMRTLEPWGCWPAGHFTDDTQMSVATARGLLDWRRATAWESPAVSGEPDLERLALAIWGRYQEWNESGAHTGRAPGMTCLGALNLGIAGTPSRRANDSKGCGGVMRVAPLGCAGLEGAAFEAGARAAALTHGHPTSDAASGFHAFLIDRLVTGCDLDDAVAEARAALESWPESGEALGAVDSAVRLAGDTSIEAYEAIGRIGAVGVEAPRGSGKGWVAEEALGIGLYCALRCRDDFAAAVRTAAAITGDSDSTASIAGAILGAAYGLDVVPPEWVEQVEDRDELLRLADELASPAA